MDRTLAITPLATLLALAACGRGPTEPAAAAGPREGARTGRPRVAGRPNLLLVTIDTLRADHLACYGYVRETSPNLDALAAEGLVFERCLAPMATTLPTHTSMLTGVWPEQHGVLANLKQSLVYERDTSLATLTEVLAGAGYRTAAFVGAFPLRSEAGLSDGFAVYDEPARKERRASDTTLLARQWLKHRPRDVPFFLWIHYYDPHSPYTPPAPFGESFEIDASLREWLGARAVASHTYRAVKKRGKRGHLVDLEQITNGYDGEILFTDHCLGQILDTLRKQQVWGETIVCVIGDHGEGLNQHREPGHGLTWNEHLQVPFVIRAPGVAPRRIADLVSVVDLAPTLLGLMDVPEADAFLQQVRGLDVLDPEFRPRALLAQSSERQEEFMYREEVALTDERYKLLRRSDGGDSLFDLATDPFELVDIAVAHPDLVARLGQELEGILAAQRQGQGGGGSLREATPEERAKLRALGYGGGDDDDDQDGED